MEIRAESKISEDRLAQDVAAIVLDRIEDSLWREMHGSVDAAVQRKVDELAEAKLAPLIEQAMEEGWQKTNSFGEPKGERVTVKERLSRMFTTEVSRHSIPGHRNESRTLVEHIAREVISARLNKEMDEELKRARKAFREKVDAVLAGKLTEALRDAVGLR